MYYTRAPPKRTVYEGTINFTLNSTHLQRVKTSICVWTTVRSRDRVCGNLTIFNPPASHNHITKKLRLLHYSAQNGKRLK